MSPSSSPSDGPFDFLVSRGPVAEADVVDCVAAGDDRCRVRPRRRGQGGRGAAEAAAAIADACHVDRLDADAVFAAAELGGNPVIPLVPILKQLAGPDAAELVHRGATSQDIFDTAAMLVVRRSPTSYATGSSCAGVAADLARAHGSTPMIGRTLFQHAVRRRSTQSSTVGRRARRGPRRDRAGGRRAATPTRRARGRPDLVRRRSSAERRPGRGPADARRSDHVLAHAAGPTAAIAGAWGLAASRSARSPSTSCCWRRATWRGRRASPTARAVLVDGTQAQPLATISARAAVMQTPGLVATLLTRPAVTSSSGRRGRGTPSGRR